MNCRWCLLVIILVSLLTSCATLRSNNDKSANKGEIIIDDGYKTPAENEIVIDDKNFEGKEGKIFSSQETTTIAADNSKITTTFDRYGNKTEKRYFGYHPRLSFVLVRTNAAGEKQVFVYGENGEIKSLPDNMLDRVLTASADEIENSAGFLQQAPSQSTMTVRNNTPLNSAPLRPLPSSNFPVYNQPARQAAVEETKSAVSPAEDTAQNAPEKSKDAAPQEKRESVTLNKKPEDER